MASGWYKDNYRHSLAARGIPSGTYFSRKNKSAPKGPAQTPKGVYEMAGQKRTAPKKPLPQQRVENLAKSIATFEKGKEATQKASELYKKSQWETKWGGGKTRTPKALLKLQGAQTESVKLSGSEAVKLMAPTQFLRESEVNLPKDLKKKVIQNRKNLIVEGRLNELPDEVRSSIPTRTTATRKGKPSEPIVFEKRGEYITRAARQQEIALEKQQKSAKKRYPIPKK